MIENVQSSKANVFGLIHILNSIMGCTCIIQKIKWGGRYSLDILKTKYLFNKVICFKGGYRDNSQYIKINE